MTGDLEARIEGLAVAALLSERGSGQLVLANARACLLLGLEPEGLGQLRLEQLLEEEGEPGRIEAALLEDGYVAGREVRLRRANGAGLSAVLSGQLIRSRGREVICLSFLEREQAGATEAMAEIASVAAETTLATFPEPLALLDSHLRIRSTNLAFCRALGVSPGELRHRGFPALPALATMRPAIEVALGRVVSMGEAVEGMPLPPALELEAGCTTYLEARQVLPPNLQSHAILVVLREARRPAATADPTGRRLSDLLSHVSGLAYRCRNDAHWTMEYIRGGCLPLTGYEPGELVGNRERSFAELILEEDRERVARTVEDALQRGVGFELEYRIVARDGRIKWVWEQGRGAPGGRGAGGQPDYVEGIIHDISTRKQAELERAQLEQQLRAAQRMEAIGTLAGGIAHDFNNLLTVIQSYASFVQERFGEGDEGREEAGEILAASRRGARLTAQLLGFSRRQVQELRVVDLNAVVAELGSMLERILGEDVELQLLLGEGLGPIRADVSQLEQVLMNLCVNARDAMPAGGKLRVETRGVELGQLYGMQHGVELTPGPYVLLSVSDDGEGMDRETLARIFEPFFTTKPGEKGTGLGLSTVYGIVKQSKGYIWAYSEPGQGTTFRIYLPAVPGEATGDTPRAGEDPGRAGSGTVLLVEDDIPLRRAAQRILQEHGYDVLEAGSVEEATEILGNGFDELAAVVTDMVLAGGRGEQVVAEALRGHPGIGVVLMSGFAGGLLEERAGQLEDVVLLEKPFSAEELLGKLQRAITSR